VQTKKNEIREKSKIIEFPVLFINKVGVSFQQQFFFSFEIFDTLTAF